MLLKNIQTFPQAKILFSTHSASLNLEQKQVSIVTQLCLVFLISDKNNMTAEEKRISPRVSGYDLQIYIF